MKRLFILVALLGSISFAQVSNLQMGDSYYAIRAEHSYGNMANNKNIKEAIKHYALALKEPKEKEEASWKLLRAYCYLGRFTNLDTEERGVFFEEAKKEGKSFFTQYPENAEVVYWYSMNLALWVNTLSYVKAALNVGSANETREIALKLIATEKKGDKVSAARGYQILGRAHQKIPHVFAVLSWVNKDSTEYYLKKSLNLNPKDISTALFLAEYYKESGRKQEAEKLLAPVLKSKPRPEEYLEDERNLMRMRNLLLE
ncbi:MAG: tetratricopeptide repeat protein [Fibromonadales bacterium]|nr:tetratricopeptide repeat protein [Fibromonadales bacterium]